MLKYITDKWPELLIVAILIPIVAIGWSMKGDLSKLDGTVGGVVQRVDRIAEAIPDLKIKLAYESTEKPFKTLILTGKAYQNGDKMLVPVNIINTKTGQKAIYTLEQNDTSDKNSLWALRGVIENIDVRATTFEDMELLSLEARQSKFAPDNIEK